MKKLVIFSDLDEKWRVYQRPITDNEYKLIKLLMEMLKRDDC